MALALVTQAALAAGAYQRAKDGKTLIWNNDPKRGEEATWSGKRDKNGFATGRGTLTVYKVAPTLITGSNIPDARRHGAVVARYSGEMVQGKFEGDVTYVDATGKQSSATFVDGSRAGIPTAIATPKPRQLAVSNPAAFPTPIVAATPRPVAANVASISPTATPTPMVAATSTPAAARIASTMPTATPAAERVPTPIPEETPMPEPPAEGPTATPEQSVTAPDSESNRAVEKSAAASTTTPAGDSLSSLTAPPSALPKENLVAALASPSPRPTPPVSSTATTANQEADAVAVLDREYQDAVKTNDAATMDRILADDFVLVTGRGGTLTKSDLIKAAREKRTNYEHQEAEEGTQKVRIWGDTAVVTALFRIKGTRDQKPLDYKIWSSDTYVRTPAGWRYVFGQTSTPLSKTELK